MSDTTPSNKSSSSTTTPEPNPLPTTPPFCCPHAILIPNPSLKDHLWGGTISHFLSTARSSSSSPSSSSTAIKTGSPETITKVMRFCASFVKIVTLSGGSPSPSSSTRDGNMSPGSALGVGVEMERRVGGREEEAAFYVQAMLKDRSGAVWMGVESPIPSNSFSSSSSHASSTSTSPPKQINSEIEKRFTRSDAAVILFCGEHSKVYKVEVREDKKKVRGLFLESEEDKEVVVERGEDGVVRVGVFVGAEREGEEMDGEDGGEGKGRRGGEEEEVVVD